jgi:inner membrane protein
MDPVAHTLAGAALAETGLKNKTRYGAAALIIGANIPDVDAIVTFLGSDTSLLLRRGVTHGILAMALWPFILTGLLVAWSRWRAKDDPQPLHLGWLLVLSTIGTWSHPLLDWMNTYGVRLLMPFSQTWFYGDTLFIIDPWFWLLTASGVVLVSSRSKRSMAGWLLLGGLASLLVLGVPMVGWGVKLGWVLGVAVIVGLRRVRRSAVFNQRMAQFGVASLILYITTVYGIARLAESRWTDDDLIEVQSNPMPGVPFHHRLVLVYPSYYRVIPPHGAPFDVPRVEPDAIVSAALSADQIKGFSNWTRFPYWTVEEVEDGWRVEFRDLRYVDPGEAPRGIGFAEVHLDQNLKPRPPR